MLFTQCQRGGDQVLRKCKRYHFTFLESIKSFKMNKTCKGTKQIQNKQANNETLLVKKIKSYLKLAQH